jgi:hypothetical protein
MVLQCAPSAYSHQQSSDLSIVTAVAFASSIALVEFFSYCTACRLGSTIRAHKMQSFCVARGVLSQLRVKYKLFARR